MLQYPGIGEREDIKQSPPTCSSGAAEDKERGPNSGVAEDKEREPNPSDGTLEVEGVGGGVDDNGEGEGDVEREGDVEGEEEGECGFCLFMKGGGCKDTFIAWEKCVEEAEENKEDVVQKCFEVTGLLKKCMDAHTDYYEPILRAEKVMEEEAARELEREAPSDPAETAAVSGEGK